MSLFDVFLRFIFMPLMVSLTASGVIEGYKRNMIIPVEMKSKKWVRVVLAILCLMFHWIVILIWNIASSPWEVVLYMLMYFPSDYGMATVFYTHIIKPLHEKL